MDNDQCHEFVSSCSLGNTEKLKELIEECYHPKGIFSVFASIAPSDNKKYSADHGLYQACVNNRLDVLKVLFEDSKVQNFINMDRDFATYFRLACQKGFHEIVGYLLTSDNVKNKPDINVGSPTNKNKLSLSVDYAALTQLGSGTPLSLASENCQNDVLDILVDESLVKQKINQNDIASSFVTTLRNGNIEGARIVKNKTGILEFIKNRTKDDTDREPIIFSATTRTVNNESLALEIYCAITTDKMDVVDFLVDECGFEYKNEFQSHNEEAHNMLTSYLLQKQLDKALKVEESSPRKKMKI